jgi:hypothetical protein
MEVPVQRRPSGGPRVHGESLKLGIEVAQSTVAKYMVKRPRRPGQSWATFRAALHSAEGRSVRITDASTRCTQ